MFLGLMDPDPLVRGMDPDPAPDPDPSIITQVSVGAQGLWVRYVYMTYR
jgi:hypothetical protein